MEIFLHIPQGVGYTPIRLVVKGSAARVVAAQKSTEFPQQSLGSV
jgi:hypothetical protein